MSTYDVAVVGRGAIGSAAALAFARAGRRVALVGPQPRAAALPDAAAGAPKAAADDSDQRVYALSPASRTLLMDLGVWQMLEPARIAPVHDMRIYRQAAVGGSSRRRRCTWMLTMAGLRRWPGSSRTGSSRAPWTGLSRPPCRPSKLVRVDAEVDGLALPLTSDERGPASLSFAGGGRLSARLVIAADGTASRLRNFAGIDHVVRDYDQTAIVANFEAERPHRDCAWQWFGDFGVVALLPLPSKDLGHGRSRVSLVWSAPAEETARALGESSDALAARVQAITASRLGALHMITPPAAFALRTVRCRQVIKPSFVLIGDAAHAIHPMAGQGMNLGFGDVRGLMDCLMAPVAPMAPMASMTPLPARTREAGFRAPEWLELRRYERSRREPVAAMQLALDGLHRAFGSLPAPLVGLRDVGWSIVARSPWLRRRMIEHAVS